MIGTNYNSRSNVAFGLDVKIGQKTRRFAEENVLPTNKDPIFIEARKLLEKVPPIKQVTYIDTDVKPGDHFTLSVPTESGALITVSSNWVGSCSDIEELIKLTGDLLGQRINEAKKRMNIYKEVGLID